MQAIILVGGFGTRLRTLVPDLPKPMAPVCDKPFLAHLLQYLKRQGITRIIFSVHYLKETIQSYFQHHYLDLEIAYAEEETPLGTGGAIINALAHCDTNKSVFVLNGDTFLKLDYRAMYQQHLAMKSQLTMALTQVADCSRYGKVLVENNKVCGFTEKGEQGAGYINAGVYLLNSNLFAEFSLPAQFSFEKDFLLTHCQQINPHAFMASDYFIDIGIPEDFLRAQQELAVEI